MNLLLLATDAEIKYLPMMKPIIGSGHNTSVVTKKALTLVEVLIYCRQRKITGVVTTQAQLISKLTGENYSKEPSLTDYAGSLLTKDGIDFVFINPLETLFTLPYGKFLMSRYISKLTKPNNWWKATEFSWEVATPASLDSLLTRFKTALLIAS